MPKASAVRWGVSSMWRRSWTTPAKPLLHASALGSAFRRPRVLEVLVRLGPQPPQRVPELQGDAGGPAANSPTAVTGRSHTTATSLSASNASAERPAGADSPRRRAGPGRTRRRPPPSRGCAAQGSTGRVAASIQADTSLSWHRVSRSPESPSERSMAAWTMSCSASERGKGEGRRGVELGAQAREQRSPGRRPSRPRVSLSVPSAPSRVPPSRKDEPGRGGAQRARDHDEVGRLRARAPQQAVALPEQRDVDRERARGRRRGCRRRSSRPTPTRARGGRRRGRPRTRGSCRRAGRGSRSRSAACRPWPRCRRG